MKPFHMTSFWTSTSRVCSLIRLSMNTLITPIFLKWDLQNSPTFLLLLNCKQTKKSFKNKKPIYEVSTPKDSNDMDMQPHVVNKKIHSTSSIIWRLANLLQKQGRITVWQPHRKDFRVCRTLTTKSSLHQHWTWNELRDR